MPGKYSFIPPAALGPATCRIASLAARFVILLCAFMMPSIALGQDNAPKLPPGVGLRQSIAGGESHSYEFELQAGNYARLAIGRSTADAVISVMGPDRRQVASLDCRRCDSSSLSLIAARTGAYRLSIRSKEAGGVTGHYDIRIAENRPQSSRDRNRIAAERSLAEGNSLRTMWEADATRRALGKYREALLYSRSAGDRQGQAVVLRAMGDAYRALRNLREARACYQEVFALASDDPRLRASAALGLNQTRIVQSDTENAQLALSLSREAGDQAGQALALISIGDAYHEKSDREISLAFYNEALGTARKAKDPAGEALALLNIGFANSDLGHKFKALDYFKEALAGWQALGEVSGQVKSLSALGHVSAAVGDKQQALDYYARAETILKGRGQPALEGPIYAGKGYIYERLGEPKVALENYLKAVEAWKSDGYRKAEAAALAQVARLYRQPDKIRLALDLMLRAQKLSHGVKDECHHAFIAIHFGLVYQSLGRDDEALSAYEKALKALTEKPSCGLLWTQAQALNGIGDIWFRRGKYGEAVSHYEKALAIHRELRDVFGEIATLCNIARAHRDEGKFDAARVRLDEALKGIESVREKVAGRHLRASYFANVRDAYELKIDALIQLGKLEPGGGLAALALEISERARDRSLLDTLKEARIDVRQGADSLLLEQERSLVEKIDAQKLKVARLYSESSAQGLIREAEQELNLLFGSYEDIQERMRRSSPRYAALTHPQPLTATQMRQLLGDDTLLLEFAVGEKRSYLWAISRSEIRSFELPGRAELDTLARRFHALHTSATPEAEFNAVAARLGQILLGPVAAQMAGKRLVVVPDGPIHYVPFASLSVPAKTDGAQGGSPPAAYRPLMLDHEISYLTSVSILSALRQTSSGHKPMTGGLAVFADPVFSKGDLGVRGTWRPQAARLQALRAALRQAGMKDTGLSRLPSSRVEAEAIIDAAKEEKVFQALGVDASLEMLKSSDLSQFRIIHFATHGLIYSERPELSSLVLSLVNGKGKSQNGFLRLHDIYNMNLQADLVVLSACETALGKEIRGEGLVSLTRGFIHAGASRVMASLWKIDDMATAELMKHFYRAMLHGKKRPSAALREAQLEMWKKPRWKSPFYWAAFVLQGEPD